ncbi:MAG: sulfotransferase domain-containing protein [Chloroflexi bacterium]|nr:sulfotransferase domain-containing protein [Chloroflexota bacterium]
MLIVANGAVKNGSTWLFYILRELTDFPTPPAEYLESSWLNPSLRADKLADFLTVLKPDDNYLATNHARERAQRDLLLAHPSVRVFDITLDIRDVVVSAYYHRRRTEGYTSNFATYYWSLGRALALNVVRYHALWAAPRSRQVFVASYERLQYDFENHVREIAWFVGAKATPERIAEIRAATHIDSLRERYGEAEAEDKLFRAGEIDDWQDHFDTAMLADLDRQLRRARREQAPWYRAARRVKRLVKP